MLKFDITYTCAPAAISGTLEYRHIYPDGTLSPWVVSSMFTNFPINTNNGTVLTHTLNDIEGNAPEFWYNTSYQFRIKQTCYNPTGNPQYTDLYSDIVEKYAVLCPPIKIDDVRGDPSTLSVWIYHQNGPGQIINPLDYSISEFTIQISKQTTPGYVNVSSPIVINYADVYPTGQFYLVDQISDNNYMSEPVMMGATYRVSLTYKIVTSTGTFNVTTCSPSLPVQTEVCYLWKVLTGDSWHVEWTDCEGNAFTCGGTNPYTVGGNKIFYVCSPVQPKGLYCKNGALVASEYDPVTGNISKGAQVVTPNSGPCDPNLYQYLTNVSPPVLNGHTCQQCPP